MAEVGQGWEAILEWVRTIEALHRELLRTTCCQPLCCRLLFVSFCSPKRGACTQVRSHEILTGRLRLEPMIGQWKEKAGLKVLERDGETRRWRTEEDGKRR